MNILICWIGQTDLNAATGDDRAGLGPIANAVAAQKYDVLCLLNNYPGCMGEQHAKRATSPRIQAFKAWIPVSGHWNDVL
ncbi:MAG: hypothetical protein FWG35_01780 [Spirochaetaceae bacterium]|nr:hypothetical protein [Spirochaetaceae bacterium]